MRFKFCVTWDEDKGYRTDRKSREYRMECLGHAVAHYMRLLMAYPGGDTTLSMEEGDPASDKEFAV